ncbi:MAG: hypothetical protein ACPL68_02125, partial [Candidatus Hydrothermia bacterium]
AGGAWVPVIVLPIVCLPWAMSIMSDNVFLLANVLFIIAFLWFLEKPGWVRMLLVIILGVLSAFTKPVGAFGCILVVLAGLLDRRARWFSLGITGILVTLMALWSFRNQALYGRFLFSGVTDFNMAFFNYPALLARETRADEWTLRDSLIRDFGQEVSRAGIAGDDRAKSALLAERAKDATGYILARPLGYALCHLSYLPRIFGTFRAPGLGGNRPRPPSKPGPGSIGRLPEPGGQPPGRGGLGPEGSESLSVWGIMNVGARVACFLLAILGVGFWWRRDKSQAISLAIGTLWFMLSIGPAGDDRTSLPAVLFACILAQGGWLFAKENLARIVARN